MTDTKEGLCYGCRDYLEYQFHGQTVEYPDRVYQLQLDYIRQYAGEGFPLIRCAECDGLVRYEQRTNGKWYEIRMDLERELRPVSNDDTGLLNVMKDDEQDDR